MFGIVFLGLMIWAFVAWKKKGREAEPPKRIVVDQAAEQKRRQRDNMMLSYKVGMKVVSMLMKR